MNESDLRNDVHYLGSSENKAWKKFKANYIEQESDENKKSIN